MSKNSSIQLCGVPYALAPHNLWAGSLTSGTVLMALKISQFYSNLKLEFTILRKTIPVPSTKRWFSSLWVSTDIKLIIWGSVDTHELDGLWRLVKQKVNEWMIGDKACGGQRPWGTERDYGTGSCSDCALFIYGNLGFVHCFIQMQIAIFCKARQIRRKLEQVSNPQSLQNLWTHTTVTI